MKMPLELRQLFGWFLLVHFLKSPLQEILLAEDALAETIRMFTFPSLRYVITSTVSFAAYSVAVYLILYYFHHRRHWLVTVCSVGVGIMICIGLRAFLEEGILQWVTGQGNYRAGTSLRFYVLDNLYYAIVYTSVGAVFYFARLSHYTRERARRAEITHRESELKFLRSQVNPHFLFNTLNNVYAQVQSNTGLALASLERLSDLLRYSLYEQEQWVPLAKEIDYLNNYVALENIRLPEANAAHVELGVFTREWRIPPMLLLPFVENAFKHGAVREDGAVVETELKETPDRDLFFSVSNAVKPGEHTLDGVGGIGIQNVRQRLELLYPDAHCLDVHRTPDRFTVSLTLKPAT